MKTSKETAAVGSDHIVSTKEAWRPQNTKQYQNLYTKCLVKQIVGIEQSRF